MKNEMKEYFNESFKEEAEINRMMKNISKAKLLEILLKIVRENE